MVTRTAGKKGAEGEWLQVRLTGNGNQAPDCELLEEFQLRNGIIRLCMLGKADSL